MPKSAKLTARQRSMIAEEAAKVRPGDLYRHLHCVGDDTAKAEVEWALRQVLDDATYRKSWPSSRSR